MEYHSSVVERRSFLGIRSPMLSLVLGSAPTNVWCQRVLLSAVHCPKEKMGVPLDGFEISRAFDTTKRTSILKLSELCSCTGDDVGVVC